MLKVGLGISTLNGAERVGELLESLRKFTEPVAGGYDVYVVEDGGTKRNWRRLKEVCEGYGFEVERNEENRGISYTWNRLTRHFDSEYMILLNDDLILVDDWLKCLLYFLENNKFGTAGLPLWNGKWNKTNKRLLRWERNKHGWGDFTVDPVDKPARFISAPGPCFGFKRTHFDLVGGFDEKYESFYEELDFGTALARLGYPSYVLNHPRVYHYWARTFAENPQLTATYRMMNSRAYYMVKWQGHIEGTYPKYMSRIPKQKIKWLDDKGEHEGWDIE